MNVFQAVGQSLNSLVSVLTATARTTEKTVQLLENEVDLLHTEQNIRITSVRSELATLINQEKLPERSLANNS